MKFDGGDLCNPIDTIFFSSEIQLICDPDEPEGWPVHKQKLSKGCHKVF